MPASRRLSPCSLYVERLIGTSRRECLDRTLFWTTADLEMKLLDFQRYYNDVSYCPTSLCA
jgi:Integrase core domain